MRLFISSSEMKNPLGTLAFAIIVAAAVIGGLELSLRSQGAVPSFDNTDQRWAQARARVQDDRLENSVLLLGASRMQAGVSHAALREVLPGSKIYNLANAGQAPFESLADIANNSDFRGLVLVSMLPPWVVPGLGREEQQDLVSYYHQDWNWARALDTRLADWVAGQFAFADRHYRLVNLVRNFLKLGRLVDQPDHVVTASDREQFIDFSKADKTALRRRVLDSSQEFFENAEIPNPDKFAENVDEIAAHMKTIRDRGGRIVLIRLPSSGALRQLENDLFPRDLYWQKIVDAVPGPCLHFEDFPALTEFDLPDNSHVDAKDKERFTRHLIAEVVALDSL